MRVWTALNLRRLACAVIMACSSDAGGPEPNDPEPDASTGAALSPEAGSRTRATTLTRDRDAGP